MRRIFNGKVFYEDNFFSNKGKAKNHAKKKRKEGFNARVIHSKRRKHYIVLIRKRPNSSY